ncbi:sensor histidine kinase [Sphingomicrobium lutaoense]|uniref:histidine kinase n=1 Tax=Sphingomicrobium lutaoense TaxID=515949 RepID=A0A839Z0X2_9SPHN|nr:histidine kinase dimerization/phosphoacceptor domain -containing protein [Sphingomicrobium lutaoense]MBB3763215.1 two-component sensor histidine kinase [Sphingomicrobium lutaoense]
MNDPASIAAAHQTGARRSLAEHIPLTKVRWPIALGATILLSLFAWWLRLEIDPILPTGFQLVTFIPVVIAVSFLFGATFGAVAGLLCGAIAWYSFVPIQNSFAFSHGGLVALLFYTAIVTIDVALIHWMQQFNRQLREERARSEQLAVTRELLFRELQHRVSNNLQMIAALLTLQRRQVRDSAAQASLEEAANRLATIGRVSRQLYRPDGEGRDMGSFVEALVEDVIETNGGLEVDFNVEVDHAIEIDSEAAIPVALIVAESIANSMEHGFRARGHGRIEVRLYRGDEGNVIEIEDDGVGLPDDFDIEQTESLGLRIALMMAQQVNAEFTLQEQAEGGTIARLQFRPA